MKRSEAGMVRHRRSQRRYNRRPGWMLVLLLLLWSVGWGLVVAAAAGAMPNPIAQTPPSTATIGTVDPVPPELQLAQNLYLQTCSSCHLALPPEVMPSQTWQQLLRDSNHYGAKVQLPTRPELTYLWNYLQTYSRPVNQNEETPYRLARSRYFRAIHPRVELNQKITLNTCINCHPNATNFNFRTLTAEWQNSP